MAYRSNLEDIVYRMNPVHRAYCYTGSPFTTSTRLLVVLHLVHTDPAFVSPNTSSIVRDNCSIAQQHSASANPHSRPNSDNVSPLVDFRSLSARVIEDSRGPRSRRHFLRSTKLSLEPRANKTVYVMIMRDQRYARTSAVGR
jgi:hypothetical protein